jgi:hypothetical protein
MLVWNPEGADEAVWARLREHFSDPEIVELGQFVQLTFGQQRVIKTWGVGHAELLADTTGGLAPGKSTTSAPSSPPRQRPTTTLATT